MILLVIILITKLLVYSRFICISNSLWILLPIENNKNFFLFKYFCFAFRKIQEYLFQKYGFRNVSLILITF